MAEGASGWVRKQFSDKFEEENLKIGRFNLAIFGKTGVGKSTLVNAIFGEEIAATGIGEPVTKSQRLYVYKTGHFGVLDTVGLEIGKDDELILKELEEYIVANRRAPLADQVHIAWYCVRAMDRRFEPSEEKFVRALTRLGLPVFLVFTQVARKNGVHHPDAEQLRDAVDQLRLPLRGEPIFFTFAKPDKFEEQEAYGLQELLDATFRAVPDAVKDALTAAQRIDFHRKRRSAAETVTGAAAAAGAAGATPIPFSDAIVLVPIQLAMMARIAHIFGMKADRATTAALAASAAATGLGRSLAGGLIKLIPGLGSVVGGTISATVASSITWGMGQAWIVVCEKVVKGGFGAMDRALDSDAIQALFMEEFKKNFRRGRSNDPDVGD